MYVDQKTEGEVTTREAWRDDFLEMRDLINERGWCQHTSRDEQGRICLMGAYHGTCDTSRFFTANFKDSTYYRLYQATDRSPISWNDTPGRTQAEVLALLERLASE